MFPMAIPIVTSLVNAGLGILGSAVATKGKEFIEDKLNVNIGQLLSSEEGKIKLAQLEKDHEEALQKFAIAKKNQELYEVEMNHTNTADARSLQKAALEQSDIFSKRFLYYFSWFWSIASILYVFLITFVTIPQANIRFADTIIGFLLGTTIAQILNYFFGSSKSSKDKDFALAKAIGEEK